MIRALLIDDEVNNLNNLSFLLHNHCEGIKVTGTANNALEARKWLKNNTADVVFLDVNMPGDDGFEFLKKISDQRFHVIFVTAYEQYALKAIKASALDYLLKPINIDELLAAVEKIKCSSVNTFASNHHHQLLNNFLNSFQKKFTSTKIALPQLGSMNFIDVDEIVAMQADSNYTIIHKKDMQKLVVSKTLKDFEDLLDADQFVRIHKSSLVNLKFIKEYSTIDGGTVKMTDGSQWSISRRQLELFLQKIKSFSIMFGK
jgi:two-component system, LytTR family, response regulator